MRETAFPRMSAGFSLPLVLRQATWLSGRTSMAPSSVICRTAAHLPSASAYSAPFPMRAVVIGIENFSATCAAASHHGVPAGPASSAKQAAAPVSSWVDGRPLSPHDLTGAAACFALLAGQVVGRQATPV